MLLVFIMSERGIEANPEKISVIMDMGSIKNLKGMQRVTSYLRGFKLLHSTTRRAQPAIVQADEEIGPLRMDSRGARGT
jgi:hypothetical protein